jgi:Na+/phosphate symporter
MRCLIAASILSISWVGYTLWVLGTPFVDAGQPVLKFVPSEFFGVGVPLLGASLLGSLVTITLGILLMTSA